VVAARPSLARGLFGLVAIAAIGFAVLAFGARAEAAVTPVDSPACGPMQYNGAGTADALIVSDLPLQGDSRRRSLQMNDAIQIVIENAGWKAGARNVAFQPCDDSLADTGLWSKAQCKANARAYAANPSVLAVVGTYNSGCAEAMIPILGQAPGGGLPMVSPGNTLICLTQSSPTCGNGTPKSLYPARRNYARVVPNDAYQGAGLAKFAQGRGVRSAFILYAAGDITSFGQAKTFAGAAKKLGIKIAGFRQWNPKAYEYKRLMNIVGATAPDAVLLAGLTEQNGAQLIKDKVNVLGPNNKIKLLAPDGFAQQSTIDLAGNASKGMFVSVPGLVPQDLTGPGKQLVNQLKQRTEGPVELFAPYAGQAASVVLNAIGVSGERAGVLDAIRETKVRNGITGSFDITSSGDPSVGPITVSVAKSSFVPTRVVKPSEALVKAARQG